MMRRLGLIILALVISLVIFVAIPILVNRSVDYAAEIRFDSERVVKHWTAEGWATRDGVVSVRVYGEPQLECEQIKEFKPLALAMIDGEIAAVDLSFSPNPDPTLPQANGYQSYGVWAFTPPEGKEIDAGVIHSVFAHDCGDPSFVITTIDFNYPG